MYCSSSHALFCGAGENEQKRVKVRIEIQDSYSYKQRIHSPHICYYTAHDVRRTGNSGNRIQHPDHAVTAFRVSTTDHVVKVFRVTTTPIYICRSYKNYQQL